MSGVRACPERDEGLRGRWPAGLAGMLALVLAVEAGFLRGARDLEALSAADWGRARKAAAGEAVANVEVLCVGDSLVKTGIIPAALEARLDRRAYNLAALGAPPPAAYALLKRAFDAGARPRAIVLDAKASQLSRHEYRAVAGDLAVLLDAGEALRLAWVDDDLGLFGLYLVHLVPSVRLRGDARREILEQFAGRAGAQPWRPVIERQYRSNGGSVLFADRPGIGADPAPDGVLSFGESAVCYPADWSPWPTNVAYLKRTLALAASRDIPVLFVIPPIHPGVQARRESLGRDAEYVALVERVVGAYANAVVVDGRHAGFGPRSCFDGRHLNVDGATALSESLAEVIAGRLDQPTSASASRWVELPSYEAPTVRMAVQDLDESRSAVARRTARR